jgi:hypothetical protein
MEPAQPEDEGLAGLVERLVGRLGPAATVKRQFVRVQVTVNVP